MAVRIIIIESYSNKWCIDNNEDTVHFCNSVERSVSNVYQGEGV